MHRQINGNNRTHKQEAKRSRKLYRNRQAMTLMSEQACVEGNARTTNKQRNKHNQKKTSNKHQTKTN
jgi:hypothetical protein